MVKRFRFALVCPECGKDSECVSDKRVPSPRVNCGSCLMARVEVVEMKVVNVLEEEARTLFAEEQRKR